VQHKGGVIDVMYCRVLSVQRSSGRSPTFQASKFSILKHRNELSIIGRAGNDALGPRRVSKRAAASRALPNQILYISPVFVET
jgi:hypothetical protein